MGFSCSCMRASNKAYSPRNSSPNHLKISYATSNEKKDNLFDFDVNSSFHVKEIENNVVIKEKECEIEIETSNAGCETESNHENVLLKIEKEHNKYIVSGLQNFNSEDFNEKSLWHVLRKHKINEIDKVQLETNDIIRLGKFPFHVRDICIKEKKGFIQKILKGHKELEDIPLDQNNVCRICLSNENSAKNPLISPCQCKGTMKWVHFTCLQSWLQEKVEMTEDELVLIYIWKELKCELCKTTFKLNYFIDNKWVHLLEIKPFKGSYILFESVVPDEQHKFYLFAIMLEEDKEIIVGRYLDCDLRINDISVSRFHAKLKLTHNKVFIEDLESKFGTLILVQNPLLFSNIENINMTFQYKSSLIKFSNI